MEGSDAQTGQTTLCFKVAANAKLRGEVLKTIGAQALGEGEVQLSASVDKHHPTQATVVASGSAAWPGGWGGRCTSISVDDAARDPE